MDRAETAGGLPLPAPDARAGERAQARLDDLTKPLGSLGDLEHVLVRLASLSGRVIPRLEQPVALVFAADHGVVAEGVSVYGQEVTEEMVVNACLGGAVCSVLARNQGVPLTVVDVGVRRDVRHPAARVCKVARGTGNIAREPAMTQEQAAAAYRCGWTVATEHLDAGADVLVLGELGIGNTTVATALAARLLGQPASALTGRGTGLDDTGLAHKVRVVEQALAQHQGVPDEAWAVMAALGGFELAALAGAMQAAAERRVPVLLDGFITSVAALWAERLRPGVTACLFAAHMSAEPGHRQVLSALGLEPMLTLGMRLGEASGALLALPLLRLACRVLAETATFAEARVTPPHRRPDGHGAEATACAPSPPPTAVPSCPPDAPPPPVASDFTAAERAAVYKAIHTRRDIRVYLPDPVPDAVLARILAAGHHAPSVGYMQPWNFLVLRDPPVLRALQQLAERERIAAASNYTGLRREHYLRLKLEGLLEAPVTVCVTLDPARGGPHVLGRNTIPETDLMSTACAIENIWLAARAEGVAVGWVSLYRKDEVRNILGIPAGIDPVALLTLGYPPHFPDEPVLQRAGWRSRLPLTEVVFENRWGVPWPGVQAGEEETV
ncbi:MAG: nicotinate-nucleotide--dimethylbenzimidazole phosphoribosyltransferase [Alicyclobacillus sp.]|nr:nicotinate-nucleotide--dimethylbenzimidazole phosphoribosyltransferase [Alicyclobacillus sp.]